MLPGWLIVGVSFFYLLILFAVAYYGDRRADQGRSIIANSWIYGLSLAVYCTAWTYFGSVGRAASGGVLFLPTYLGPTLGMLLAWLVVLKMIRIARSYRITSIADFIASRYGKSHLLGGLVTVIAVVGVVPYIALQLKAISSGYALLVGESSTHAAGLGGAWPARNLVQANGVAIGMPNGQLYNTIANGFNTMSGYASQIPVADRWAIVLYVRALQRGQNAELSDDPATLQSVQ